MNWSKQTDKPLFEDILWSRPENRRHAGKLLVIGGHAQNFSAVSEAYAAAGQAGAGTVRVIVPDKLRPMLSKLFMEAEYAASNEIGSFSRKALAELLDTADWADAVLLAGDFGKNSETTALLESFALRYQGLLCLAGDSLEHFTSKQSRQLISSRADTILVGNVSRLQKLATPHLIKQSADFLKLIDQISDWSSAISPGIATWSHDKVICAVGDRLSSTSLRPQESALSAYTAVWSLQHPGKSFEALTTAAYALARSSQ